jgi:hypothetical protein
MFFYPRPPPRLELPPLLEEEPLDLVLPELLTVPELLVDPLLLTLLVFELLVGALLVLALRVGAERTVLVFEFLDVFARVLLLLILLVAEAFTRRVVSPRV